MVAIPSGVQASGASPSSPQHDRNPTRYCSAADLCYGSQLRIHDAATANTDHFRCDAYDLAGTIDGFGSGCSSGLQHHLSANAFFVRANAQPECRRQTDFIPKEFGMPEGYVLVVNFTEKEPSDRETITTLRYCMSVTTNQD